MVYHRRCAQSMVTPNTYTSINQYKLQPAVVLLFGITAFRLYFCVTLSNNDIDKPRKKSVCFSQLFVGRGKKES